MSTRERKDNGSLTRLHSLQWDSDDRLRQVQQWNGASWDTVFTAGYDGDGSRVTKSETWPELGSKSHTYSWGPGGILHDSNGDTRYTPGLAQRQGTDTSTDRYFHSDWLGSTRYLSDATGTSLPSALRYDAFGNRSSSSGADAFHSTDFQWGGAWGYQQEWGSATEPGLGLEYLEQRYYDPAVGRFISPDPIGFAGGLNLYGYAEGDPVSAVDPSGLGWRKTSLTVLGGVLGGIAGAPEGGIGAIPGAAAGAGFGRYLGGRLEGESIPQAAKGAVVEAAVSYAGGRAGAAVIGGLRARKAARAAQVACETAGETAVPKALTSGYRLEQFRGLNGGEVFQKFIKPNEGQQELIDWWFLGGGKFPPSETVAGSQYALEHYFRPPAITRQTLEAYREIALQAIEKVGNARSAVARAQVIEVQGNRLHLINRALNEIGR